MPSEVERSSAEESGIAAAFFHELDAWTEYWDIYHPETEGHYYFGADGASGLLNLIVPRRTAPPIFTAWRRYALGLDAGADFARCAAEPVVAAAIKELDALVGRIFERHYGDAADELVCRSYLRGMHRFATNALPPARERAARLGPTDPRRRTAGHHTIDVDMMWFIWAIQLEAAQANAEGHVDSVRSLLLAGVATGCAADYTSRGHRRTRPEYRPDGPTEKLLLARGSGWAKSFEASAEEVHQLFQIREWGRPSAVARSPSSQAGIDGLVTGN